MSTRPSPATIKYLYLRQGLSRDGVAKRLHVSRSLIATSLHNSRIKLRPRRTPSTVTTIVTKAPHAPRITMEGERVVVQHQVRLTRRLAYTLGLVLGDGYVNKREIDAIISAREQPLIEPIVRRELERFGHVFTITRFGTLIIRCNSTLLARALCSPNGKRYYSNIDFILHSHRYASSFITGFWDADGGKYREPNGTTRAHLYNSRPHNLEKIAVALQTLYAIETTIYKRAKNKCYASSGIHQRLDRFDLYVRAKSNKSWLHNIANLVVLPWKKLRS